MAATIPVWLMNPSGKTKGTKMAKRKTKSSTTRRKRRTRRRRSNPSTSTAPRRRRRSSSSSASPTRRRRRRRKNPAMDWGALGLGLLGGALIGAANYAADQVTHESFTNRVQMGVVGVGGVGLGATVASMISEPLGVGMIAGAGAITLYEAAKEFLTPDPVEPDVGRLGCADERACGQPRALEEGGGRSPVAQLNAVRADLGAVRVDLGAMRRGNLTVKII